MDVFRILGLIVGRTLHPRSVQYSEHGKNLPGTFVVRKEPPYIFATKKITCQTLSKLQQMEITSTGLSEYKYALLIVSKSTKFQLILIFQKTMEIFLV